MIKEILSTTALLLIVVLGYGQTFVNLQASGNNDGTSWSNAYTDLSNALAQTTSGDIWVAAGTYKPTGDGVNATFLVDKQVNLYGGFDGTENSLTERDLTANTTILSGDQDGNDIEGDWFTNRDDNSLHVVFVDSLLSIVAFDGFEISGGNTMDDPDLEYETRTGGGIFSYSSLIVTNSVLKNNFGRAGASVAVTASANGGGNNSIFTNSTYTGNRSTSQSAGIFCNNIVGLTVSNCEFAENITVRGALYPFYVDDALISNCSFRDNEDQSNGFGGAMFFWQPDNLIIENCEFVNNTSGNGGAMYIDGREENTESENIIVRNCQFTDSRAVFGSGGAIRGYGMSMTIENCDFTQSFSNRNGGALLLNGPDTAQMKVLIKDNNFERNRSSYGGAAGLYSLLAEYDVIGNNFERNTVDTSGGALYIDFGAEVRSIDNSFVRDTAMFGGAVYTARTTTDVMIENCVFQESVGAVNGGAINIFNANSFIVTNSQFELNNTAGFGGAINAPYTGLDDVSPLTIANSSFVLNSADAQAGALNTLNANVDLTNNLFAFNTVSGNGAGGAIALNALDGVNSTANLINNSLVTNEAFLGSGLATFTDVGSNTILVVNLLNNIFDNQGNNYELEEGDPIMNSLGGNVSTDNSAIEFLAADMDINLSDDLAFADPFDLNFELTEGSPAIDNGIADGAPTTDIDGNPRINAPDAGAYEFDPADFIKETVVDNQGFLTIKPNPVQSELNFEINNNWTGNISLEILDISGQLIYIGKVDKVDEEQEFQTNVSNISTGVYFLVIKQRNKAIVTRLVKL